MRFMMPTIPGGYESAKPDAKAVETICWQRARRKDTDQALKCGTASARSCASPQRVSLASSSLL